MSWKQRVGNSRSHASSKYDSAASSGDEHLWHHRGTPSPAKDAEEALWRASKRICAAARWLKLDLAILAESSEYVNITNLIDRVIISFGSALLLGLGSTPLSAELTSRTEVLELISMLSSLPTQHVQHEAKVEMESERCKHTHTYVQTESCATRSSWAQCTGDYMTRWTPAQSEGKWVPLDESVLRVGAVIKCIEPVWSSNADGNNVHCTSGLLAKIMHKDGDGDVRVVFLTEAQVSGLHIASDRHWF